MREKPGALLLWALGVIQALGLLLFKGVQTDVRDVRDKLISVIQNIEPRVAALEAVNDAHNLDVARLDRESHTRGVIR